MRREVSLQLVRIILLKSKFGAGFTSTVRGMFTYRINDAGLIINMLGYWNRDAMAFGKEKVSHRILLAVLKSFVSLCHQR